MHKRHWLAAAIVLGIVGPAHAIDLSGDVTKDLQQAVAFCAAPNVPADWANRCATARSYLRARQSAAIDARAAAIAAGLTAQAAFIDAANAAGP